MDKAKILSGLTKWSKRGITSCTCGTINGTKAFHCKKCGKALKAKHSSIKKAQLSEIGHAVRLVGPDVDKIFSVHVPNNGLNFRSFVQIFSSEDEGNWGLCYVVNCPTNTQGKDGSDDDPCSHIQSALDCCKYAKPLRTSESFFSHLQAPPGIGEELKELSSIPYEVVQMVNSYHFVVKCSDKSDVPLGFVHCYFNLAKMKAICDCFMYLNRNHMTVCEHLYACFWAMLSDEKLQSEYSAVLLKYLPGKFDEAPEPAGKIRKEDSMDGESSLMNCDFPYLTPHIQPPGRVKLRTLRCQSSEKNASEICLSSSSCRTESLKFSEWLSSAVERINQQMHFELEGKTEPIIFHIPEKFFECLKDRISAACGTKRVPDNFQVFFRDSSPPIGSFTKYTYEINSLDQVKKIFRTNLIQLEPVRSFIQKGKSSYHLVTDVNSLTTEERATVVQTRIKVGAVSNASSGVAPFTIEWIPKLLPVTRIGELCIKFEFGHFLALGSKPLELKGAIKKVFIPRKGVSLS